MDYKAIGRAITDPENQPHQWTQYDLGQFFISAADEIERLRLENSNMEKLWGKSEGTWMGIRDKQELEIERLREALQYYADPLNYEQDMDAGELARAALKETE